MLIFKLGVYPHISWDLTINLFPLTWLETSLDPLATRYLKSWLGLAKPADPSRFFLRPDHGGLGLPSVSGLYNTLQVGKAALLMMSRDRGVQFVSRSILDKEAHSKVAKFKLATFVQQHSCSRCAADLGASFKFLSLRSKKCVQVDKATECLAHDATLKVQGRSFEIVDGIAPTTWSKAVQSLPSGLMKFALNAAQDTLPHNVNLAH